MNTYKLRITDKLIGLLQKEIDNNTLQLLITSERHMLYLYKEGFGDGDVAVFRGFAQDELEFGNVEDRSEWTDELIDDLQKFAFKDDETELFEVIEEDTTMRYRFVYRTSLYDKDIEPFSIDDEFRIYNLKTSNVFDRNVKILRQL